MGKKESRIGNYIFSLLFIVLGIFVLAVIKIDEYQMMSAYSLGPGFFPACIAAMMIVIGCLLIWYTFQGAYDREEEFLPKGRSLMDLIIMVILTALGVVLIRPAGMILTIALYYMGVSRFVCKKPWKETVISTFVAAAAIYIVFNVCFKVRFPVGIFGF